MTPGLLSGCDFAPSPERQTPVDEGLHLAANALRGSESSRPALNLQLHPKQKRALESPATEQLYGGAAGGGKSFLMRVAAITWCSEIAGLQVYLFRRVSDDLHKNHMDGAGSFPLLLAPWISAGLCKVNWRGQIEFWNGSKIHLCHCQYEKDVYKYQGAEIHVLLMDELTTFTSFIYAFLRGRVRLGGLEIPEKWQGFFPRILCGSNPGNVGHNWVKQTFVDRGPFKIWRAPKADGGMLRQFIPARLKDNPTMTKNDPNYEDKLRGLGKPHLIKAMLRGDWNIVAGGMFDDLWEEAKHLIRPTTVPISWKLDRSYDYGSSAPFSVCWWAESDGTDLEYPDGSVLTCPKGTVILFNEWYGWNGEANKGLKMLSSKVGEGIKRREQTMLEAELIWSLPDPGPADSAIFTVEDGNCIATEMALAGIKWLPANKSPGSRIAGWEVMRRMLTAALERPMEKPGLLVFDTCRQFVRTVPVLPRDPKNEDDVNTDAEDHIGDATRYRLVSGSNDVGTARVF